jgi:hypothetical protein
MNADAFSELGRQFATNDKSMALLRLIFHDLSAPRAIGDYPVELAATVYGELAMAWPHIDDVELRRMASAIVCRLHRDHHLPA